MPKRRYILLFVVCILGTLCEANTSETRFTSTLERWRHCIQHKDIWPDSARWSSANDSLNNSSAKTPLYIAGLMPFSDEFYDQLVCTVLIAIDHVNANPNLLPDYELRFVWNWTYARPGPSLQLLYDVIYNFPQVVMAWGPTYSRVGEELNRVAGEYHLVQIGIAQFQASQETVEAYPYTVQIYPANTVFNPARIALLKRMGWKSAAIVYQNVILFRNEMEEFATMMQAEGLKTIAIESLNADPVVNIESLKRHDARIIFLHVYQETATRVLCEVYKQGLYGPKYVWILVGFYHAGWWRIETNIIRDRGEEFCTVDEVAAVAKGYLSMRGFEIQEDLSEINFNGIYPDADLYEFYERLQRELLFSGACDSYGYDQIITIALALNASKEIVESRFPGRSLASFTYEDTDIADIILQETKKVKFVGLTGPVAFDDLSSRESDAVIQQLQNGTMEQIFVFDRRTDDIRWKTEFQWGGSIIPVDGPTEEPVDIIIENVNRIVIFVLASLGIVLAILFLVINIAHRKKRALKISSPLLNNVIAVGGIFLYCSTFLLNGTLEIKPRGSLVLTNIQCQSALLVACVGLSMSFGALFMKTYRIHQIYTSAMKVRKVLKGLTDSRLMFTISWFIIIDLLFFAFWMSYDPMTIKARTYTPIPDENVPEMEISFVPTLNVCTSANMLPFMAALGAYKGGLLLFGVFLAWSTRNVRIMELNDSGAIIFATTIVLCLVFVPKVAAITESDVDRKGRPLTMGTASDTMFEDKDATLQGLHRTLQEKLQERKDLLDELALLDRLYMHAD